MQDYFVFTVNKKLLKLPYNNLTTYVGGIYIMEQIKPVLISVILIGGWFFLYQNFAQEIETTPHITLGILNDNKIIGDFYGNLEGTIGLSETMSNFIYVSNEFSESKNISIKIKILNSTMSTPDSIDCRPSQQPIIYEENIRLEKKQSINMPLNWSIRQTTHLDNFTHINFIKINKNEIVTDIKSLDNKPFRLIVELWTYEEEYESYVFGYRYNNKKYAPWNQLWFIVS